MKNTIIFQIGSVGAMLVQAIAGVILARTFGPEEFGRFSIAISMSAVASIFLGAGATDAMAPILARAHNSNENETVTDGFNFLGKFMIFTSCFVLILGFTLPMIAGASYGDSSIGWYGLIILCASAISTILFAPTQLALQIFNRVRSLSALTFIDQSVRQILVVTMAILGFGVLGAASGHMFGAIIVACIALLFKPLPSMKSFLFDCSNKWKEYIAPTLWVLIDRNLAMLYGAAPVAIAGLFLTTTDVSYFKIALGWITLALAVLSPISTLLNTELARIQIQKPDQLRHRFLQTTLLSVCASTVVTAVAALIARPIFSLLYGPQYINAVPLVYWLIPFGALFGLGIALGPMWRALNRVRTSIIINLIVLGVGIPLSFLALNQWGSIGAVAMVTGWYTISHTISFSYLFKMLGKTSS